MIDEDNDKWFCQIGNVSYGPMRFQHLQRMVAHGQIKLSPRDLVKRGQDGEWAQVESISSLMLAGGHYERHHVSRTLAEYSHGASQNACAPAEKLVFRWRIEELLSAIATWASIVCLIRRMFNLIRDKYLVAACMVGWLGLNSVLLLPADYIAFLENRCVAAASSPTSWLVLLATIAYGGAIWYKLRAQ